MARIRFERPKAPRDVRRRVRDDEAADDLVQDRLVDGELRHRRRDGAVLRRDRVDARLIRLEPVEVPAQHVRLARDPEPAGDPVERRLIDREQAVADRHRIAVGSRDRGDVARIRFERRKPARDVRRRVRNGEAADDLVQRGLVALEAGHSSGDHAVLPGDRVDVAHVVLQAVEVPAQHVRLSRDPEPAGDPVERRLID